MHHAWTLDQCLHITKDHPISNILKIGQKRQVIQTLRQQLKEEERERLRLKHKKSEEEFVKCLLDTKEVTKDTPFRYVLQRRLG